MEGSNTIRTDRFKRIQGACLRIGDKVHPVYEGINTVGRNKVATINIKHLNVSQNQAIIVLVDDQQHFISDVNSSNGTFLCDTELVPFKLYKIANNTKITFGDIVGTYFKISNDGNFFNVTETAEMTQDITQNFYAANTQLVFDQTVANQSNEHSYFNPRCQFPSGIPDDIHELNTQVVEYLPQNIKKVEPNCNELSIQIGNLEECVVEELVNTDIHDAPTQVVDFSEQKESGNSVVKKQCEKDSVEDIQVITGFKELLIDSKRETTQVLKVMNNLQTSQNSGSSSEATQILNEDETQKVIDLIKSSMGNKIQSEQQKSKVFDSFGSGEAAQIVNEEKSQKAINTNSQGASQDMQHKNIVVHSSQTPCSSGLNKNTTFENDESLLDAPKRISTLHGDIEDTFVDGSMSNDSVDFLTMQTHNDDNKEIMLGTESGNESPTNLGNKVSAEGSISNKSNHDSSSSDMFHRSKKPIPKLPSEKSSSNDQEDKINSDSDTDIENSEDIGRKKTKPKKLNFDDTNTDTESIKRIGTRKKPLRALNSDSDTDIEDTQDIGFRKKPLQKLNSDEDLTQPKILDHVSDSDTDCEDIKAKDPKTLPAKKNKQLDIDSGSDTDIEDEKHTSTAQIDDGDLNDTDCIPATQDAFAEAFDYKAQRLQNSCNQSSEESFKLGITELLEDSIENDVVNREKQADKVEEITDKNGELSDGKNDEICVNINEETKKSDKDSKDGKDDNIYILPTQKIKDKAENPKHTVKDLCPEQIDEETPNVAKDNDDVYLLATQKLDSQTDVFTDFKAPSRIFTFRKKTANLEDSLTTILSNNKKDEEDIYLMATQNINEPEPSGSDKNDDVYLQATQKLEMVQEKKEHDIFSQPTQCLISEKQYEEVRSKEDVDEDIYEAATQQMDINLSKKANTKEVAPVLSRDQEDAYMQDTQKIQENIQIVNKANSAQDVTADPSSSKDECSLDPQTDDTQFEMPFTDDNVQLVVTPSSNRPQNPLIQVLNDQSISEEEGKPSDSPAKRIRDIQEDVQESPSKKIKSVHIEHSLEGISSHKNDVETLSQIEDFIKKPLIIVPLSRKSTIRKEPVVRETSAVPQDDVETLLQIEAFIKKPLEVPKYRKSMRTERNQVIEEKHDTSETLSQIEAFVKQPLQKVEGKEKKEEPVKAIRKSGRRRSNSDYPTSSVTENEAKDDQRVSKRLSKGRVSNTQEETKAAVDKDKLDVIKEYNEADDFEDSSERFSKTMCKEKTQSRVDDDENPEKSHSFEDISRYLDVKSDVDQSFALLDSKCSKVRRKPCKDPVLNEIKVSVTSHRRSVSTAETSKKPSAEILFPSRKSSRRTTVNNNIISTTASKKKRKPETIVSDKKEFVEDLGSELSDSEVPTKIPRKNSKEEKRTRGEYSVSENSSRKQEPSSSKRISRIRKNIRETDDDSHTSTKSDKSSSDVSEINLKASKSTRKDVKAKIVSTSEESDTINELPNDNENEHILISRGIPSTSSGSSESIAKNSRKTTRITNFKIQSTSEESDFVKETTTPQKNKLKRAKENESSTSSESLATPRRGQISVANESLLSSAERSRRKQKPKVVFTMLESPQLESFIKHLGGSIVDKVDSATVLVTEHVKRSQKLLTAVAQGKPICSPKWIHASKRLNEFVDPWDYILIDEEAETKWNFSLKRSLLRAANDKLLVNYTFQLMVTNAADVLKGAIEASGGKCVTRNPGKNFEDNFIIVASPEHKTKYTKLKKQNPNITIIEPEAIFDGVLRQELRFSRHLVS